jgi:hypothetical protein
MAHDVQMAPWSGAFTIDWVADGRLPFAQIDARRFVLDDKATIRYEGCTGLEGALDEDTIERIREVDATRLPATDLASIPPMLRWFANTYGLHTPAALIHDWLIDDDPRSKPFITNEQADRYFRFMLGAVGVPFFKRWIMWSAVALATRFRTGGVRMYLVVLWALLATAGIVAFGWAALGIAFDVGLPWDVNPGLALLLSLAAPWIASSLWGRQYGAGVVGSMAAPWILPPTAFASVGFLIYRILERGVAPVERFVKRVRS